MADTTTTAKPANDPAAVGPIAVAVTLLIVLGTVMSIGAARYSEPDLAKLLAALGPLLGIVTGAFVTFFFTRSSVQNANQVATTSSAAASRAQDKADSESDRSRDLHNALTEVFGLLTSEQIKDAGRITAVQKALDQPLGR